MFCVYTIEAGISMAVHESLESFFLSGPACIGSMFRGLLIVMLKNHFLYKVRPEQDHMFLQDLIETIIFQSEKLVALHT